MTRCNTAGTHPMDASHPLAGMLGAREAVVSDMLLGRRSGGREMKRDNNPQDGLWHEDQLMETGCDLPKEFLDNGEGELCELVTSSASSQTSDNRISHHRERDGWYSLQATPTDIANDQATQSATTLAPHQDAQPAEALSPENPPVTELTETNAAKPAATAPNVSPRAAKPATPRTTQPVIPQSHPSRIPSAAKTAEGSYPSIPPVTKLTKTRAAKPAEAALHVSPPVTKLTTPGAAKPAIPPSHPTGETTAATPEPGGTSPTDSAEPTDSTASLPRQLSGLDPPNSTTGGV